MSQMYRRPDPRSASNGRAARPASRPAARPSGPARPEARGRYAPRSQSAPQERYAPRRPGGAPGRPAAAPRRSAPGGRGWLRDVAAIAVGGLVVAVLALLLQGRWPNGFPLVKANAQAASSAVRAVSEIHSEGPLRINEIMTGNRRTLTAEDGVTPDWMEIMNVGNSPVNLRGWSLAKTENGGSVFTFPDWTLESGECALVLADSRLRAESGESLHAPFRLSSSGDTLMLFNAAGTAVDTVNIPALGADCAYARTGTSSWEESAEPTPGLPNTPESYRALTEPSGDSPVLIQEIVASNATLLADENGEFHDYVKLYNRASEAVDLAGWCLSDDAAEARKWRFPQVSIAPGETLVVFASGLDRTDDPAHLHTNFSLSSEGEQVVLTDASGRMMDLVDYPLLKTDETYQK